MQEEKATNGVRAGVRLGPAERVTLAADFARIYKQGRRAGDGLIVVVVARNDAGHPRLALAVGKKQGGKAHDRNRLRRLYREAFRLEKSKLPPVDAIVSPGKDGKKPDLARVRASLVQLVAKAASQLPRPAPPKAKEASA